MGLGLGSGKCVCMRAQGMHVHASRTLRTLGHVVSAILMFDFLPLLLSHSPGQKESQQMSKSLGSNAVSAPNLL